MQNFKENYQSIVKKFKSSDANYYQEFLRFCGRGNILSMAVYNQMKVYDEHPTASELHEFDAWTKLKRMPKKGTGIQVMNREKKTGIVFKIRYVQ